MNNNESNNGSHALNPQGFPPHICFGVKEGKSIRNGASPANVKSLADLPGRFFLGDLDKRSFQTTEYGWRVRYPDKDRRVWSEVSFDAQRGWIEVNQSYYGNRLVFCGSAPSFARALESYGVFPIQWAASLQSRVAKIANIQWPKLPPGIPSVAGFPDGLFTTLFVPVPVRKLEQGFNLLASIGCDSNIKTRLQVSAIFGSSLVCYDIGRTDPKQLNLQYLHLLSIGGTGLPPAWISSEYRPPGDDSPVITVRRNHYVLRVDCVFRELERIICHVKGLGLVGHPRQPHLLEGYPNGAEFGAFIIPLGAELLLGSLSVFGGPCSRRVIYPQSALAGLEPDAAARIQGQARASVAQAEQRARELARGPNQVQQAGRLS